MICLVQQEAEGKPCSFIHLGLNKDISIELAHDLLADEETKTNSLSVHLLCALQATKHFEQLLLIFFRDPCSCVKHCDHNLF